MLNRLLRIFFPSPCLVCGYLGDPLCNVCFEHLDFKPHVRQLSGLRVYCAMLYEPGTVLEKLIHPFKYKHQASIFRLLVPHMAQALRLMADPHQLLLVPVPLHTKRLKERGYNQSELLAKWVAKELGCSFSNVLIRHRNTHSQAKSASKQERQQNMQGAFRVRGAVPKGVHIVLVDDIVTTGSTLLSCHDVLAAAGADRVSALTLADREKQTLHSRY